jgi:hypothetical protein
LPLLRSLCNILLVCMHRYIRREQCDAGIGCMHRYM